MYSRGKAMVWEEEDVRVMVTFSRLIWRVDECGSSKAIVGKAGASVRPAPL